MEGGKGFAFTVRADCSFGQDGWEKGIPQRLSPGQPQGWSDSQMLSGSLLLQNESLVGAQRGPRCSPPPDKTQSTLTFIQSHLRHQCASVSLQAPAKKSMNGITDMYSSAPAAEEKQTCSYILYPWIYQGLKSQEHERRVFKSEEFQEMY